MQNKRGQGLSTNAIVLIVLAVIVLVLLVIGFTAGWDKLAPWLGSSNNVDVIVQQCSVACSAQGTYDFCMKERDLTPEEKADELLDVSCYYLSEKKTMYGIESCKDIDCNIFSEVVSAKVECAKTTGAPTEITYLTADGQDTKTCVEVLELS